MEYTNNKTILLKSIIFLSIPILIYWKDLLILYNEAINSEISTHIILIPFIIGYIVYTKRDLIATNIELSENTFTIINNIKYKDIIGSLLCLISLLIRWYGSYSFNSLEYHIASIPIFISGLILIFFNFDTLKTLQFPVFLLLFLIPPPFEIAQQIGSFLAVFSAVISYNILKIAGYPVLMESLYGNPIIYLTQRNGIQIPFTIDIGCSGLYSFIGLLVFAVFFTYISKGSISKKILVMLSGFPILYSLNIVRISLLLLVGYYFGAGTGLNIFHLLGGWTLTFLGSLLILILSDRIFKIELYKRKKNDCNHEYLNSNYCSNCGKVVKMDITPFTKNEIIKYFTVFFIVVSLITIDVPTFAINSGQTGVFIKKFSGEEEIKSVLPEVDDYSLEFFYRDTHFEEISGQNSSLLFLYNPLNSTKDPIWVQVEIGSARGNLHNWEVCLINYPSLVNRVKYESVDMHDIHLLDNPPLSARFFSFNEKNETLTQVVLYWFAQSVFQTDNGYQNMWSKISVIQYVDNPELYSIGEANILPVAQKIANYWHPITSWSEVTISIAKYGPLLIGGLTMLLVLTLGYVKFIEIDRRKKLWNLFTHITDPIDRKIIETLDESAEKSIVESEIYSRLTNMDINEEALNRKLIDAKEIGFIQQKVINKDDEPYIAWSKNF